MSNPLDRATRRQIQVLDAYIDRGSMKEAADRLGISVYTVRAHLGRLRDRTGLASIQAACFERGRQVAA